MAAAKSLVLKRSRRKYQFALMPLADTMFQLLIFFMLSSNLTPFSMLTLRSAIAAPEAGSSNQPGDGSVLPGNQQVWTLRSDTIIHEGGEAGYDQLEDLSRGFADAGPDASIILLIHSSALMQNVASVLEALQVAGIDRVQISPEAR